MKKIQILRVTILDFIILPKKQKILKKTRFGFFFYNDVGIMFL